MKPKELIAFGVRFVRGAYGDFEPHTLRGQLRAESRAGRRLCVHRARCANVITANRKDNMSAPITVAEVIELYLDYLLVRRNAGQYGQHGYDNASTRLRAFAGRYGAKTIAECKQHDISAWLTANPQYRANNTKKCVAVAIVGCFTWALEEELIDRLPYRRPRCLRGLPNEVRRPATPAEYIALMSHNSSRALRRALYFLRRTGARTCEMQNLIWDEVYLDGPVPYISMATHKTARKTGKPRRIGLDPSVANFLRNLRRQASEGSSFGKERRRAVVRRVRNKNEAQRVFLNSQGTSWDRHIFARHLRKTAERIGLDEGVAVRVSGYCLRHLYCVDAIEAGLSTRKIADQLGHQSTEMIDRIYGSETRQRVEHLTNVATEISHGRKKMKPLDGEESK